MVTPSNLTNKTVHTQLVMCCNVKGFILLIDWYDTTYLFKNIIWYLKAIINGNHTVTPSILTNKTVHTHLVMCCNIKGFILLIGSQSNIIFLIM